MKALIDGDVLRYEVGFGAETGWAGEGVPPWPYVQDLLHTKLEQIVYEAGADSYTLYLTKGKSFRHSIAKTKPYKGHRVENKPYHWKNLTAYMIGVLNAEVVENGLEADDQMAIESVNNPNDCIICSRDKDLRQIPGHFYSWELHMQPSFGPVVISREGSLELTKDPNGRWSPTLKRHYGGKTKLTGTGFAWFCAQVLTGDRADNIPGLPGWGPVKAYEYLKNCETLDDYVSTLIGCYADTHEDEWEDNLLEQGRLCWLVRRMKPNGEPELWELGMTS